MLYLPGTNSGAATSLALAAELAAGARVVSALIVVDPAGLVRLRVPLVVLRATLPWLARPTEARSHALLGHMTAPGRAPDPGLVEWMTLVARHTRPTGAPGPLPAAVTARWRATPRVAVSGELDPFLPPARLGPAARDRLGVGLILLPGQGHPCVEDDPTALAAVITTAGSASRDPWPQRRTSGMPRRDGRLTARACRRSPWRDRPPGPYGPPWTGSGRWDDRCVLVQACVNGARRPVEHPALPVTPRELADDVARAVAAGVGAVHLHVKDVDGVDTLAGAELAAVLGAVRAGAAGVPVGVTTGAWAMPDPGERVAAVRAWPVLPDFASVNWHEGGAEDVAAALLERGVGVEAGLWHAEAVGAWLASPLRGRCLRVLLELPDGLDEAGTVQEADRLLAQVAGVRDESGAQVPVLLHGEGSSCWPALRHAGRRGVATRIGLEDVLELPDGAPAPDNAALLAAARRLLAAPAGGG